MVAGRNIGFVIGIFSMTATWVGGGYINGSAQAVYESGLVWCQAPFGYSCSIIINGLFFAKRMRQARYVTMLDPFERYGKLVTSLVFIPALLGDIFWSSAILSALGSTLEVISGLEHKWAVISSTAVALLYTLLGGLYSVVFTDVVQFFCVLIGLWLTLPFAMTHPAVSSIVDTSRLPAAKTWLGSLPSSQVGLYIDTFLLIMLGGVPWQAVYQRILSQRTPGRARLISLIAGFMCIIFATPAILMGAISRSTAWNETDYGMEPDSNLALPMVMQYLTPTPIAIIGLGAVSAAVMSSTDSAVLSSSSMFARNVYTPIRNSITHRFKLKKATEIEVLIVMRVSLIFIATIATVLAIVIKSIYGLFVFCSDLSYVILFPQMLCAIWCPVSNTYGCLAGYIVGTVLRLTGGEPLLNFPIVIKYPWYDDVNGQLFPFKTLSMLISLFLILTVSRMAQYLFEFKLLPDRMDVFRCFVVKTPSITEQQDNTQHHVNESFISMTGDSQIEMNKHPSSGH